MYRTRDVSTFLGLVSTGDTAPLVQVPAEQLRQTLCCCLAYIQRGDASAVRFLAASAALRGVDSPKLPALTKFTSDSRILHRYNPQIFYGYINDGTRILVSEMSVDQLVDCTVRAFIVCERVLDQGDGFKWWNQRPAITLGPRLQAFMSRAESLPPLGIIESNLTYSRVRRLDPSIKARLIEEMGIFDDIPEFSGSEKALMNIPLSIEDVSLESAISEFLDRIQA